MPSSNAHGYTEVQGLNALLAVLSTPTRAPVIAASRLRKGSATSARGVARFVADALVTATATGATGMRVLRADSGFYAWEVIVAATRGGARFSITARGEPVCPGGDRGHRRSGVDPDPLPQRHLRRRPGAVDLRRRGRRNRLHRVHLPAQGPARERPG